MTLKSAELQLIGGLGQAVAGTIHIPDKLSSLQHVSELRQKIDSRDDSTLAQVINQLFQVISHGTASGEALKVDNDLDVGRTGQANFFQIRVTYESLY